MKSSVFGSAFRSEDDLRKALAELFRKMGHEDIRITHGGLEKGKDIVFFGRGPLGEKRLFACVVKNAPLTGKSAKSATSAITVVNQVLEALNEPLVGAKGESLWTDSVYVISPFETSPAALEAIRGTVHRSGQIVFLCGEVLLKLFAVHWPEFLWFESTVLQHYLVALRHGLGQNFAMANLILRNPYLDGGSANPFEAYVAPQLNRTLRTHHLSWQFSADGLDFKKPVRLSDVRHGAARLNSLAEVLSTSGFWPSTDNAQEFPALAAEISRHSGNFVELWEDAFKRAKENDSEADLADASPRDEYETWQLDASRSAAAVSVAVPPFLRDLVTRSATIGEKARHQLKGMSVVGNDFVASHPEGCQVDDPMFLEYCKVADVADLLPFAFQSASRIRVDWNERLLQDLSSSVLITAPAGYGKTTFCRYHALHDARRLAERQSDILPIYFPLYQLVRHSSESVEGVIFSTPGLREIIHQREHSAEPSSRLRLYLDGLDELADPHLRDELAQAAQRISMWDGRPQVVLTSRDHVRSSSLAWLPRIELSPLRPSQVDALTEQWLDPDDLPIFRSKLALLPSLQSLMQVPLLATLVLVVYRRTKAVPPTRAALYSLFVELLCGGWDVYKNVQRGSQFGIQDKLTVLTRLAALLHNGKKRSATEWDFQFAVQQSLPAFLPQWQPLLNEISQDGLLVRAGAMCFFAHFSLQEFLAALDLHDPAGTRPRQALLAFWKGDDWWREPMGFYVTLTRRPGQTDEWLMRQLLSCGFNTIDLEERVTFLRQAIRDAFPSFDHTWNVGLENKFNSRLQILRERRQS